MTNRTASFNLFHAGLPKAHEPKKPPEACTFTGFPHFGQ
jgi:hypothetical protein